MRQAGETLGLICAGWDISVAILCAILWCPDIVSADPTRDAIDFPSGITRWKPYSENPVFVGGGTGAWDERIRERGTILREGDTWHFWYTGYNLSQSDLRRLGYATSKDGIHWQRQSKKPLVPDEWVEDMHVVKHDGQYIMVAEGRGDLAHMLTSKDGIHWSGYRKLDVRKTTGEPISAGPYGTPTLWYENGLWYLFYERGDRGVWLATSADRKVWTNVQDDPVISLGPAAYDRYAIAVNQIIKINNRYYALYHANADPRWRGDWRMCLAVSDDLVRWKKYSGNPILEGDYSSGQLVPCHEGYRLYTPHPQLRVFFPAPLNDSTNPSESVRPVEKDIE
ncbi:MAG: glycosylase [Planctomycetaceae bacterium]|nr:glycosylase [Planctomycetaceae bacterium]